MRIAILLSVVSQVAAFGFGGFNLPSVPFTLPTAIPSFDFGTALPSVPTIPSIPETLRSELPSNPYSDINFSNRTSRLPIPSLPEVPSSSFLDDLMHIQITKMPPLESLFTKLPSFPTPLPFVEAIRSFTAIPSIDFSMRALPTPPPFKPGDLYEDLADLWRRNHTLKVPESVDELRDLLANKTRFDLAAADAFVDRLGSATGQDVHGGLRLVAGLVLTNESFGQFYERTTDSFRMAATRLRGEAAAYNFSSGLKVLMPALGLGDNQTLSVMQWSRNPYEGLSSAPINSSVISIMVADLATGNETKVANLDTLLNFTLPVAGQGEATCVFWNGTEWSGVGCQLLDLSDGVATCGCNHLTDFALIVQPPPTPGPTVTARAFILMPAATEPTPSGTSPLIIGLASGGALLGAILLAAAYMNWRHSRQQQIKKLRLESAPAWSNNYVTQVIVKK